MPMEPTSAPPEDTSGDGPPFVVAGIGASAGGLEALEAFFAGLPETDGIAFVVILHLAPDEESRLAEILQSHLPIPVAQVTEAVTMEPGHVYVIPPNKNLRAEGDRLVLEAIEDERVRRRPIDHFFRTLAGAYRERAVGVILSGTGANGTVGVRAVREAGGFVAVQAPTDAQFDEMPRSAIASGVADVTARARDLAPHVVAYAKRLAAGRDVSTPEDAAQALQSVLAQLRARTGHDFSAYKRSTVLRRLERRLHVTGAATLTDYLTLLRENAAEASALLDDLLISVTHFFRDPEVFAVLAAAVPGLFEGKSAEDEVRVWVAGCATGEEAYSVAMLLCEHAATLADPPRVQVFATDLSEAAVQTARAGVYPESIEADVPPERLRRFFQHVSGHYRVVDSLRETVLFAPHSLLKDPPFARLDLVSCRNLLIYLQRDLQQRVLGLFHYALRPGGLLLLGTSESADGGAGLFGIADKSAHLYRRRDVETQPAAIPTTTRLIGRAGKAAPAEKKGDAAPAVRLPGEPEQVHHALRAAVAAPSVLVGENGDVVHVSESAAPFLQVTTGTPTRLLARMLRPELRAAAQTVLFQARREGGPASAGPVEMEMEGARRLVRMRALPDGDAAFVLVGFETLAPAPSDAPGGDAEQVSLSHEQLRQTQEQLQVAVEEFETSREELRAQNEELQSINEELRSTAEELETSKEEAQSMAEELQTVNDELKTTVAETVRAKGDLENLIASTEIATLFLDRGLHIQRFTPPVRELFHVLASDVGRPLSDLAQRFGGGLLIEDAEAVVERLVPREREVEGEDGRWYLVHVRPYRSGEDRIDGVVVTFVDITRRKRDEETIRQNEARLRQVADTVPDILFRTTAAGVIDFANETFRAITGRHPDDAPGVLRWPDLVHAADRETTARAWAEALRDGAPVEMRHRLDTPYGTCWYIFRATPVRRDESAIDAWFGTATDVDALTKAEARLRDLNATLEQRVAARTRDVRRLSARLSNAEQSERRRLAHVLHDDLQQQLAGLAIVLRLLREARDGEAATFHDRAETILGSATSLTRTLASEISPPTIATEDFVTTVRWLAGQKRDQHQMAITVEAGGPCDVPDPGVRALLYEALRELLFNIVKHAGTRQATIRLARADADVVVVIEDEGDGFAVDEAPTDGFGLFSVRERVELAGGHLEVASAPGEGTRITITVPAAGIA